jgi:DNA-binding beta-propeller fold protein YncE
MLYSSDKHMYERVDNWAKCPEGWSLLDVLGIAIDSRDRVYVLSGSDHPVTVFDREGRLLTTWGEGLFKFGHSIRVGPDGCVYCVDTGHHTVSKFTAEGKLLMTLGNRDQPSDTGFTLSFPPTYNANIGFYEKWPKGKAALTAKKRAGPPFNGPSDVAVSSSGEIYVSDGYCNARVHKFRADGTLLSSWGEVGDGPGQFINPHSIWLDKQERIWVTDRENCRVQIFNAQGEFLSQWTELGYPQRVFIDEEANVYVIEAICQRVSIFTIDGKLISRLCNQEDKETAPFVAPHAIAVDSRGDIYIGNTPVVMFGLNQGCRSVVKLAKKRR